MKDTKELELKDVDLFAEYLELEMLPQLVVSAAQAAGLPAPAQLGKAEWTPAKLEFEVEYPGEIETIQFIRSNGKTCTIGGEKVPPFYNFLGLEKRNPHPPLVTYDVFDMGAEMMLPKPIKVEYKEVLADPPQWAKFAVDKF
ncbi:MAG: hypothetical protein ACTSUN_07840 [Promethearchaeota archaeon]